MRVQKALLVGMLFLGLAIPAMACDSVEGLTPLLQPGSLLLLGEMHGTVQSQAFAVRAACLVLGAGHAVTLALEIPVQETDRIAAYLGSAGDEVAQAALLSGPFWTDRYQDGRRSEAMLALVEDVRTMRRKGRPVRLVLLDTTVPPADGRSRDQIMADNLIAALDASQQDVFIVLTGNLHSRVTVGSSWNPKYEPMGYFFTRAKPAVKVTALDVAYPGGTAWTCDSADAASCKVRAIRGKGDDKGVRVILHPLEGGFHGVYNVGPLTASPPAAPDAKAAAKPSAGPK
jgi:hypothetical protein